MAYRQSTETILTLLRSIIGLNATLIITMKKFAEICENAMQYSLKVPCTILSLFIVYRTGSWGIILYSFILDILIGQLAYLLSYVITFIKLKRLCRTYKLSKMNNFNNSLIVELLEFYNNIYSENNYTKASQPILLEYILNKDELSYDYFSFPFYDTPVIAVNKGADLKAPITQARIAHEIAHIGTHFAVRYYQIKQYIIGLIYLSVISVFLILNNYLFLFGIAIIIITFFCWTISNSMIAKREVQADNFALKFIQLQYGINQMRDIASRFIWTRLKVLDKNKSVEFSRIKSLLLFISTSQKEKLYEYLDDLVDDGTIKQQDYNQIMKYMRCEELDDVNIIRISNFSWGEILWHFILIALTIVSIQAVPVDLIFLNNVWSNILIGIILFVLITVINNVLCVKKKILLNRL